MENKLVDTIVTDKNGVAASKKLEKGRYNVQEIETNKWYILDKKIELQVKKRALIHLNGIIARNYLLSNKK